MVKISYDPKKREQTLADRSVDFDTAPEIFEGPVYDQIDDRFEYGEIRTVTVGFFRGRMMIVVWTERQGVRHIISMRKANDREQAKYKELFGTG
jgi:uncharacterized DUF497 family protein